MMFGGRRLDCSRLHVIRDGNAANFLNGFDPLGKVCIENGADVLFSGFRHKKSPLIRCLVLANTRNVRDACQFGGQVEHGVFANVVDGDRCVLVNILFLERNAFGVGSLVKMAHFVKDQKFG